MVAAIQPADGDAFSQPVDISSSEQVKAMVDATVEQYGRLDVALNKGTASRTAPLPPLRHEGPHPNTAVQSPSRTLDS